MRRSQLIFAFYKWLGVLLAGATVGPIASAQESLQERSLDFLPPVPNASRLGERVAVDGEWAVVSARLHGALAPSEGGAAVYRHSVDGWVRHTILYPLDGEPAEQFSSDGVAIRGDTIAVSSFLYRLAEPQGPRGRVHIFEYDGVAWMPAAVLIAPDFATIPAPYNGFGFSVAFGSDDELLVSAPTDLAWTISGPQPGSLYVFRRNVDGRWVFAEKSRAQPPFDQYPRLPYGARLERGESSLVALRGSGLSTPTPVTVMERGVGGSWEVQDVFDVPGLTSSSAELTFDVTDEFVVVGDSQGGCASAGARPGQVYVFRRLASGWSLIQVIQSRAPFAVSNGSGCTASDQFGSSVSIVGDRLAVGALEAPLDIPGRYGSVEVFRFDGTQFQREYILLPSNPTPTGGSFGDGVAIAGDSIIVGAPDHWDAAPSPPVFQVGAAYFYDLPRGSLICPGQPNSTGQPATLAIFGSRSAAIGDVYGTVQGLPASAFCLPVIGSSADWVPGLGGGQGNLCLGGELGRLRAVVGAADLHGEFTFDVDASSLPLGAGPRAIAPGDRWGFQVSYRDISGGTATHNLTDAVSVTFGE